MNQHLSLLALQILLLLTFSFEVTSRTSFATPVVEVEELKARIKNAVCAATKYILMNIWLEPEYGLHTFRAITGALVEFYGGKLSYKKFINNIYNVFKQL